MNIIVDISPLSSQPITGIGQILENLIAEFRRREDVDLSCFTITARGYLPELKKRYPELKAPSIPARLSKKALRLATLISFPIDLLTGPADAVISAGWLCLPLLSGKTVAIVADLTPVTNPEWHKKETITLFRRRLQKIQNHADVVVAISNATKKDLLKFSNLKKEKIIVSYPGIPKVFHAKPKETMRKRIIAKYKLPEQYLLFTGTQEPRKNLSVLTQVFDSLRKKMALRTKLVLVGDKGWGHKLNYPSSIMEIGLIPALDLPSIYSASKGLVYPSFKEGFGLPIVEAFAMETPVLTSNTSSLREIAKGAAILVDPNSENSIKEGLIELLTLEDLVREKMVGEGKKRLKMFSFEKMADTILNKIR